MSAWISTPRLAALALPGFPASPQGVNKRATQQGWPCRRSQDSSHAREYPVAAILPTLTDTARDILLSHISQQAAAGLPAPAVPAGVALSRVELVGDTTRMTHSQRAIMDARAAILAWVEMLAPMAGGITQARHQAERQAKAGMLPAEIARLAPLANAKAGKAGGRTLSGRSLRRWYTDRAAAGGKTSALAPKIPEPDMGIPPWGPALLALYRTPQKRSLKEVVEKDLAKPEALPEGIKPPSYDQAKRWLSKVCSVEKSRGRMGPKELRSIRPFVSRDTTGLWPLDVVQADGHCFDSEVEHPRHHRAMKPELTSIIDLATRMIVGWSAGLSENALAVSDAIISMALRHGVPAVWYVDNGSGYNNQLMDGIGTGLLDRLGTTKLNREADNPQAGGYVERSHQTLWIAAAKELPTYLGREMDRQASQKVHKITRKDLKAFGRSRHLMPWAEFLAWAEEKVREYNNRPHRSLPRITDPETGRRRHMTPVESWAKAIAEGWQPISLSPAEAADLTRPHEERVVQRGTVTILGNTYEHRGALESWHGETVQVAFDVADASKVWVKDLDGRLICEATYKPKVDVVPRSYLEAAYDRRFKGREQRLQAKLDEVRAERDPRLIDITVNTVLPDNVAVIRDHLVLEMTATPVPAATATTIPETATGRYRRWRDLDAAITAGDEVSDDNRRWHQRYPLSYEWQAQAEIFDSFGETSSTA